MVWRTICYRECRNFQQRPGWKFLEEWFLGSRHYLFGVLFLNFERTRPQRWSVSANKAGIRDLAELFYSFAGHFLFGFSFNLLRPLSWWWVKLTNHSHQWIKKFLKYRIFYIWTAVLYIHILFVAIIFVDVIADDIFPLRVRRQEREVRQNPLVDQVVDLKDWSQSSSTCRSFSTWPPTVADILTSLF